MKKVQVQMLGLLLLLLLSSCSHTKDLTKTKVDDKTVTDINTVTTRTVTEISKDTVEIKADTLHKDFKIKDLITGDTLSSEDNDIKLIIRIDTNTHKLKTTVISKKKIVPININKTTVEVVKEQKHEDKEVITNTKEVHKKVTGGFNLNYLWWLLLLLLIPIWRFRKILLK